MENLPYTGGCLCGHIRFRATGHPDYPHACSCVDCQHHSGAPLLGWVEFPPNAVTWTGTGQQPARYRSSAGSSRTFCPQCGSTLGAIDDNGTTALVTGSFDHPDAPLLQPRSYSFEDGCPAWVKIAHAE